MNRTEREQTESVVAGRSTKPHSVDESAEIDLPGSVGQSASMAPLSLSGESEGSVFDHYPPYGWRDETSANATAPLVPTTIQRNCYKTGVGNLLDL